MKKITALLLCLIMAVGIFAGCTTLKEGEKGATISVYLSSFPQTLDPALVQLNSDVDEILGLIFEPLTTIDENGKVVGALAEEWYSFYDTREDAYQMYFKLKQTSWSDKRPVSADDIIYAWKRILAPETDSPYASLLYPIKNAKMVKTGLMTSDDLGLAAANSDLLVVTFENDYNIDLFAEAVANIHLAPIREDVVVRAYKEGEESSKSSSEEDNTETSSDSGGAISKIVPKAQDWAASAATIVCNGPYTVKAFDEGSKIVLERNPYYMREEDDYLDKYVLPYRIVCKYQAGLLGNERMPDVDEYQFQAERFKDGRIFYLGGFNKDTYNEFKKNIETKRTLNSYVYYFNTQSELLKDQRVRQALSVALDRSKIVNEITGTGEVAATGYVPYGVFDADRKSLKNDFRTVGGEMNSKTGDMEKAQSLLREANAKKGTLTITYLIPESATYYRNYKSRVKITNIYEDIANYAKSVWEQLGYTVNLRGLHPTEYLTALYNRDFEILGINNIMDSVDAFAYLAPFSKYFSGTAVSVDFTKEAYSMHYTGLESDEYDELIDSILKLTDRKERVAKLHEAERMFTELCPATALFYYSSSYVKSSDLKNVETTFFGYKNFNDLKLKNYREINAIEESLEAEEEGR
ncbi:MAG TPA: ABC transporter substrate-binding protein [Bacillota bacterium]|nr:ABC transporter substrate-binding protein [Bacillota bacterium]HOK68364.1 ABC transporter substrate-binding protein [Bacillota bacterium]HPP85514.1 ABC transporter substrate-binding protein [Bacillota bacterium]